MDIIDSGYYRTYLLIEQDFAISILKQINVLYATGIELFISSLIALYENEIFFILFCIAFCFDIGILIAFNKYFAAKSVF